MSFFRCCHPAAIVGVAALLVLSGLTIRLDVVGAIMPSTTSRNGDVNTDGTCTAAATAADFGHTDTRRSTVAKLFLTSSGCTTAEMKSAWNDVYKQAMEESGYQAIVYVPTALMMTSTDDTNAMEQQARYVAQQLGVPEVKILELTNMADHAGKNELDQACCVYIEMGNTYFVTYHVRRTGLDQAIQQLLANGGLYAGSSAGAILAGQTIRTCEWKNWDDPGHGTSWDLQQTSWKLNGLNLLTNNASIFPHYNDEWDKRVKEMKPKHEEPVIVLDEEHAYVQDEHSYQGGVLVPSL